MSRVDEKLEEHVNSGIFMEGDHLLERHDKDAFALSVFSPFCLLVF